MCFNGPYILHEADKKLVWILVSIMQRDLTVQVFKDKNMYVYCVTAW